MTQEEYYAIYNQPVKVKCIDCGTEFDISRSTYNSKIRRNQDHPQFRCKECTKLHRKKLMTDRMANMTQEEKDAMYKKVSDKKKDFWKNVPKKQRAKILDTLNSASKNWRENETEEERSRISEIHTESNKRRWENMTEEEREAFIKKSHDAWMEKVDLKKFGDDIRLRWKNQSMEKRNSHIRNMIRNAKRDNGLGRRFEREWNRIELMKGFHFIAEYNTDNNSVNHCWDYGVFDKDNQLVAVVDLDGSYYHADVCDYDGIHSKLEYDEKRGLSIPNNTKWFIIYSDDFEQGFNYFIKNVNLSYDEFIRMRFKEYRSTPFPQPHYTDIELMQSYSALCNMNCSDKYHQSFKLNTRLGDRLIQHFHTSLYDEQQDMWKKDDTLIRLTEEHAMYHSCMNKNKILQGLNVSRICPNVRFLSPARLKIIIHKYLQNCNEIFTPYNSYSEIMLAAISMGKRYIGMDTSINRLNESRNLAEFLSTHGISMDVHLYSTLDYSNEFECLLTEITDLYDIEIIMNTFKAKKYIFIDPIDIMNYGEDGVIIL